MQVTDKLRQEIREWMTSAGRTCPISNCKAPPEFIEVAAVDEGALRPSTGGVIDTSDLCHIAKLRCTKCGFDEMMLVLEDAGLRP